MMVIIFMLTLYKYDSIKLLFRRSYLNLEGKERNILLGCQVIIFKIESKGKYLFLFKYLYFLIIMRASNIRGDTMKKIYAGIDIGSDTIKDGRYVNYIKINIMSWLASSVKANGV
jgi:hypothetical protein